MCVIVYSYLGKKEKEENIKRMFEHNSDGIGFAYKEKNQIIVVKKGFMKLDEFLEFYRQFKEGTEHAIHFRLASSGTVAPEFTHPFPLDKIQIPPQNNYQSCKVLFHNGHIEYYPLLVHILPFFSKEQRKKLLSLKFSDTYILSLYISIFQVPDLLEHLKSKFLLFSKKTKIYGSWEKEDFFYYSNTSWKPRKYFFTRSYYYETLFQTNKENEK